VDKKVRMYILEDLGGELREVKMVPLVAITM